MPINVKWGSLGQTFILFTVENPFLPTELLAAVDEVHDLLDSVDHQASTIIDFTSITGVPRGLISMYPTLAAKIGHPKSTGFVVFTSQRYRWMAEIFSRLFKTLHFVDTLEEAEAMVSEFHARSGDLGEGEKVLPYDPT